MQNLRESLWIEFGSSSGSGRKTGEVSDVLLAHGSVRVGVIVFSAGKGGSLVSVR
jgi:hypothetical protein